MASSINSSMLLIIFGLTPPMIEATFSMNLLTSSPTMTHISNSNFLCSCGCMYCGVPHFRPLSLPHRQCVRYTQASIDHDYDDSFNDLLIKIIGGAYALHRRILDTSRLSDTTSSPGNIPRSYTFPPLIPQDRGTSL